jgi:Uma2 family endonuclease
MSSASTTSYLTPEQYEEIEERSEIRHEYYRGEMFAMAGTTENHTLIAGNIARELGNRFEGRPCKVYQSDMRVKVRETGLYTYPDVVAVCGPARFDHAKKTTLVNPTVVIEVLSPSTELYDRTRKLDHYKAIESLVEIALVAQDHARIDLLRRVEDRWEWTTCLDLEDVLRLESVGCEIPLARVYDRVELQETPRLRQVVEDDD